jgi:hypothetical protein
MTTTSVVVVVRRSSARVEDKDDDDDDDDDDGPSVMVDLVLLFVRVFRVRRAAMMVYRLPRAARPRRPVEATTNNR